MLRPTFRRALPCLAVLAFLLGPTKGLACTMPTFSEYRVGFFFTFTALADTLDAGWGNVSPRGPVPQGSVSRYGQLVRVSRVGGDAAAVLSEGTDRVLVVPWSYDAGCQPLPWTESARWLEPGETGVMWAELRDPELWIDGIPTADVHNPYSQPYPRKRLLLPGPEPRGAELMRYEDVFHLLGLLPRLEEHREDPARASAPLLDWARENPTLALQPPASGLLLFHQRYVHRQPGVPLPTTPGSGILHDPYPYPPSSRATSTMSSRSSGLTPGATEQAELRM
jgi:hypothetical protein